MAHYELVLTSERNRLQDLVWSVGSTPEISIRCRRELAQALDSAGAPLFLNWKNFEKLLDRLWVLDDHLFGGLWGIPDRSLRREIEQHVLRNPDDWPVDHLFEKLGVFEASDRRVILFLEGLAAADVRPDDQSQHQFVDVVNGSLRRCGLELRETGIEGGYSVFSVVSLRTAANGGPKNLIFASPVKPDIRFRDAVNNDVEIVENAERVLVYDRPIGVDGLRWCDLQTWWSETQGISDQQRAKKTLYRRLSDSLPTNSPPQRLLFHEFHKCFGAAIPKLPALLPEVWLHWDPKTVKERGSDALLRFRMDFLLLLPQGGRAVIEVDGKHHYATEDGRADPARYANLTRADRELQLAGYQVFHFGAVELEPETGAERVRRFFTTLFDRHGIKV